MDRRSGAWWGRWIALAVLLLSPGLAHAALDAADCAACHQSVAAQYAATGGHAIVQYQAGGSGFP